MAKRPVSYLIPLLLLIGGLSLVLAGSVMAAAANVGFGASMFQPMPMSSSRGFAFGLFRMHRCGNGKIEYREQCDDGNRVNDDGCSRWCRVEPSVCSGRAQGERFPSPDGCNTCVCTRNGIACTMRACAPSSSSSSASSPQACGASRQCPAGHYCTTADGDCRSACPPGAEMCTQVCMGVCRPNACKPYVCPDGTRHPSCSENGHVINYIADPCLTHQSSSPASRCGNGICESGEAASCPPCIHSNPPCLAVCSSGTCPRDCEARKSSPGGCTAYCSDGTPYNSCTMGPMNPCLGHASSSK